MSAAVALAPRTARSFGGWLRWLWVLVVCLASGGLHAQDLQAVPPLTARVMDLTQTLKPTQVLSLDAKLAAYERERGSQVVVLMLATTAPEDIADYAQRVGDAWKIGRAGVGDGVLLIVAKDDRRLRIATMKAVEGAIPDLVAKQIIDQAITPHFKRGDYAAGLNAGADAILARLSGEDWAVPSDSAAALPRDNGSDDWILWGFGLLFLSQLMRQMVGDRWVAILVPWVSGGLAYYLSGSGWIGLGMGSLALAIVVLIAAAKWGPRGPRPSSSTGHGVVFPDGGGWGSLGGGGGDFSSGGSDSGGFSSGGGGDSGGGGASGGW